jgi:hypothetical protein
MAITVDQAYAIDPATGQVDMDLFRQFAHQQQGANASNSLGAGSSIGNPMLTLGQQYMAGNADVQQDAISRANAEGLFTGDAFSNRLDEIALQHFNLFGVADGRTGFGYTPPAADSFSPNQGSQDSTLSNFANPVQTQPYTQPSTAGMPASMGQEIAQTLPGASPGSAANNAPLPGQMPGYDFTGDINRYANEIGNFGGLLNNLDSFYAGQVPSAPTMSPMTGGYNAPELSRYPNANYASGAFPIIWTS